MDVGSLAATLSLNMQPFMNGLQSATRSIQNFGSTLGGALGPGPQNDANNMGNSVRRLSSDFKDLDRIVGGIVISQIFYGAINAIEDAASSVLRFSNEMEKAAISMQYFLGSAEKAQGFILQMKDFAADTAFSTEGAINLSKRLLGANFKPEELRSVMSILNDANAATGATRANLDRIVLAMTQMKTSGRILGGELRQFAEAGIPIYQLLKDELGLTGDQLRNIGKLKIDADKGIAALLNGLQKRYKGAAEELAQTLGGMWDTIADDSLFVSQEVFSGWYAGLKGVVKDIRDALEEVRTIMTSSGLGGVLEHFVPPEFQDAIRMIIGAFGQLGDAVKLFMSALQPAIQLLAGWITTALATVLPVITGLAKGFAMIANAAMQANPWLQYLAAAIIGLMVAQTAARALMFLWSVTRLGAICTAVAGAVTLLGRSVQFLTLAMTRNPIGAVIMIVAGALLYLATSSKTASAWLDQVMARLGALSGIKVDQILQPVDNSDQLKWMDEYNKSVSGLNDSLKDTGKQIDEAGKKADKTGKKGEKAGKKIKDKFVASFDELYQVPDQLDKVNDAVDKAGDNAADAGGSPTLPDIKMPDIKMGELPAMPDLSGMFDDFKIPPFLENLKKLFTDFEWPKLPPPNFAVVTEPLGTINSLLDALKQKWWEFGNVVVGWPALVGNAFNAFIAGPAAALQAFLNNLTTSITGWLTSNAVDWGTWAKNVGTTIVTWATETNQAFVDWIGNIGNAFSQFFVDVIGGFGSWAAATNQTIVDWIGNTTTMFTMWVVDRIGDFSRWNQATILTISTWVVESLAAFADWSVQTFNVMAQWSLNFGLQVSTAMTAAQLAVYTWASNTMTKFTSWTTNVKTMMATWATWFQTQITTWSTATAELFTQWAKTSSATFAGFFNNIAEGAYNWSTNFATNINAAMVAASQSIADFSTSATTNLKTMLEGTSAGVYNWSKSVGANMAAAMAAAALAVRTMASSGWQNIENFASGSAEMIRNWANVLLGNIVKAVMKIWDVLSELAEAVGAKLAPIFGLQDGINLDNYKKAAGAGWDQHGEEVKTYGLAAAITLATAGLGAVVGGVVGGFTKMAPLLGLEHGGIIDQEQFIRVGEKNRREAVVPMENETFMRPFSRAVARDLAEMGGGDLGGGGGGSVVLNVGILVADRAGLKQLERQLESVRIEENARKGRG
ncbi:hypothetical protein D3C81_323980 [compost metagenome]